MANLLQFDYYVKGFKSNALSLLILFTEYIVKIINFYNFHMTEEKKAQISKYLRGTVSPFITPLMEELVKHKPSDLLEFTKAYVQRLMSERNKKQSHSDSEQSQQDQQEANKKFMQKLKQKKNQKKISRQGISAQVYGMFNKKQQFVPQMIEKPSQTKQSIRELLKRSVLFRTLADEEMNIVIDAMSVQNFQEEQQVIKEGDEGLTLYVVGSGQYQCSKIINGIQTYLKTYKTGESFGQLALMYTAPRAASIKCSKPGLLYGLDRQTFKHIVQESANKRRQKFRSILSKVSILSEIDPYEKQQLCDILKEQVYSAGDYIVKEGQQGNKFYMIAQGSLIAQKGNKKVFQFKEGDYFGEISLIRNTPRQASVKCVTPTKVVYIQRDSFKRMFGPIQEILKRNQDKYKQYISD